VASRPKAFIALKPGHAAFGIDELRAFLATKLAKYEMPTEMEIHASLPKTPVGKLSRFTSHFTGRLAISAKIPI